jgi:hypothetical protein
MLLQISLFHAEPADEGVRSRLSHKSTVSWSGRSLGKITNSTIRMSANAREIRLLRQAKAPSAVSWTAGSCRCRSESLIQRNRAHHQQCQVVEAERHSEPLDEFGMEKYPVWPFRSASSLLPAIRARGRRNAHATSPENANRVTFLFACRRQRLCR